MHWISISTAALQSREFVTANPIQRSAWLSLLAYCAVQENGGRICGAKRWNDVEFAHLFNLRKKVVENASELWSWGGKGGADLLLKFYPRDLERSLRVKRLAGKEGARRRWGKKSEKKMGNPLGNPLPDPLGNPLPDPLGNPLGKPMRMKGNVRKGKGECTPGTYGSPAEPKPANGAHTPPSSPPDRNPLPDAEPVIPTLPEVLTWASMQCVPDERATRYWSLTSEDNGWIKNGRLIEWRKKFQRLWTEDQARGAGGRKQASPANAPAPALRQLWQIEQDLGLVRKLIEEHPCDMPPAGATRTPEQLAEYSALVLRRDALIAERLDCIKRGGKI